MIRLDRWVQVYLLVLVSGCASAPAVMDVPDAEAEIVVAEEVDAAEAKDEKLMTPGELEEKARTEWEEYKAARTWEEWLTELGLSVDPGPDPDPNEEFLRFGQRYTIEKFEKKYAVYRGQLPGYVRPFQRVSVVAAIYRDDEEHVWVFMPVEEEPETYEYDPQYYHLRNLSVEAIDQLTELRGEFIDVRPEPTPRTLVFAESSNGLPAVGSWRNSPAVADINSDGNVDIVAPPQRGSIGGIPSIFLGDGRGNWEILSSAEWPRALDYGSVDAGDIDGDGHMDLLFGVHLRGLAVFLGDGTGRFVESSSGLPKDSFPTRRANLVDVDRDGDLDIFALTEGPASREAGSIQGSKLRLYLNDGEAKSWTQIGIGEPGRILGGDWLAIGDFDGDVYPDVMASSNYFHGTDVVWRSLGEPIEYKVFGRGFFPWNSYIGAVRAADIIPGGTDELVVSYSRFFPERVNPAEVAHPAFSKVSGLDLVRFDGETAQRDRIITWRSQFMMGALAVADFDGDGHLDILYTRKGPYERGVLFGDGEGSFVEGRLEGFEPGTNSAYDMIARDVNSDGRADVIMMFEDSGARLNVKDGSIRVWLNRGPAN